MIGSLGPAAQNRLSNSGYQKRQHHSRPWNQKSRIPGSGLHGVKLRIRPSVPQKIEELAKEQADLNHDNPAVRREVADIMSKKRSHFFTNSPPIHSASSPESIQLRAAVTFTWAYWPISSSPPGKSMTTLEAVRPESRPDFSFRSSTSTR